MSSLPVVLRAAQHYAKGEAQRLAETGPTTETIPDFSALANTTFSGGFAHLLIDPRNQPRIFDVPLAYFLKVAEALGGNLLLNSRQARSPKAMGRLYVRLDIGPTHVYVNRIVKDAQIGEVVRERGTNFRSHLPEDLSIREAPLKDGPGKHITGRQDAIGAILAAYERADDHTRSATPRDALESLLNTLLALADARASERLRKTMLGVVLKGLQDRTTATRH